MLISYAQEFIEAIDGVDNGVTQYPKDVSPKYRNRTDLSSRVSWLNPAWNESVDSASVDVRPYPSFTPQQSFFLWSIRYVPQFVADTDVHVYRTYMQERFAKASKLTGEEFLGRLDYYGKAWLPARDLVVKALNERTQYHPSGKIIVFEQFAPWKVHLHLVISIALQCFADLPFDVVRNISSNSRPNSPSRLPHPLNLSISSTPTKPPETGASKPSPSRPNLLTRAKPSQKSGAA